MALQNGQWIWWQRNRWAYTDVDTCSNALEVKCRFKCLLSLQHSAMLRLIWSATRGPWKSASGTARNGTKNGLTNQPWFESQQRYPRSWPTMLPQWVTTSTLPGTSFFRIFLKEVWESFYALKLFSLEISELVMLIWESSRPAIGQTWPSSLSKWSHFNKCLLCRDSVPS